MALFFCFIPLSKIGADTVSSNPGIEIDLPDDDTLADLNASADDAQNAVDDITDASDDAIDKALGDDSTDYKLGADKTPLYVYTSYLDTDNKIKVTVNMAVQAVFMSQSKNIALQNGLMTCFLKSMLLKIMEKLCLHLVRLFMNHYSIQQIPRFG